MTTTCQLYLGDCLDILKGLPADTVDLTVTSPPYNVGIDYKTFDDNRSATTYFCWLLERLAEIYRVTKPGGRLCLNLPESTSNGENRWNIWELFPKIIHLGWMWRATHIWYKPNHVGSTAWGSFKSPSCPSVRPDHEFVFVFYKMQRKLMTKGVSDLTKEEFAKFTKSVWSFPGKVKINSKGKNVLGHNAPFPEELPYRCIKLYSWVGVTVLDPFMGSGTTGLVARQTGRNFIGVEIDPTSFELAKNRLQKAA